MTATLRPQAADRIALKRSSKLEGADIRCRRKASHPRHRAHARRRLGEGTIAFIMTELPEALFSNPVWHALHGPHRHLAIVEGSACRYPADVSPFAAIAAPAGRTLDELRSLLAPDETVWIVDYGRTVPGLNVVDALDCVHMVLPADVEPPLPVGRGSTAHRRECARDGHPSGPAVGRSGHPACGAQE